LAFILGDPFLVSRHIDHFDHIRILIFVFIQQCVLVTL
jgi:hypothetical protein